MILEAIVTTQSLDNRCNIAPMGPVFDAGGDRFELRPFQGALTLTNLQRHPFGVLHVTDNVLIFAQTAIHRVKHAIGTTQSEQVDVQRLTDCCRWYEFRVVHSQITSSRASLQCQVVHFGRNRDFFGFNRAKHAVIEAAILATRIDFLPFDEIRRQFEQFASTIEKTGGDNEKEAFQLLDQFVLESKSQSAQPD